MGGCATKPKVLKGDEGDVLVPTTPREADTATKEAADVVAVTADGEKKVETDEVAKEKDAVVVYDNIDDQSKKRPSLSNLFKEKEKEVTTESDNTPSELETAKQEPSSEPFKQDSGEAMKTEAVSMNQEETKEPDQKPIEPVSGEIKSAQPMEAKPATGAAATVAEDVNVLLETQHKETLGVEKKDKAVVEN